MARILILIGGHLCTAPRPQKEAEALACSGHDVTIAGFWFDPVLVERDRLLLQNRKWRFIPILDFQPQHRLCNLNVRLQGRIAREQYRRFKRFSPGLLGYGAWAMLKMARNEKADLTIVHSEAGLWVGNQLLNEGFRVGVDFEDWFSEDLPLEARQNRPIAQLKQLEKRLIQDCQYCLTTSHAMAESMADAYQAPKPTVIYNSFPWAEREQIDGQIKDRKNLKIPSIHWFSQTIGPGRGLEILFQSLPYLKHSVEIHLRGNCSASTQEWLQGQIPQSFRHQFFIHSTVPNAELLSRIVEHDVGLALETSDILSRDLTITNKLFQYFQAGLAILATNTSGQQELMNKFPDCGSVVPDNDPLAFANTLNTLILNSYILKNIKGCTLAASEKIGWENNYIKLSKICEYSMY